MNPELRPAGPSPTRTASSTTILLPLACLTRRWAAAKPAKPAPITSQSAVILLFSGVAGSGSGSKRFQPAGPGSRGRRVTFMAGSVCSCGHRQSSKPALLQSPLHPRPTSRSARQPPVGHRCGPEGEYPRSWRERRQARPMRR